MIKKILLVDDEPNIVKSIKLILEMNHYNVSAVTDGKDCLKKLVSEKPDLMILDFLMPEMTAYDILVAMKQIKTTPAGAWKRPRVIILTGSLDDKLEDLIKSIGKDEIQGYLVKPVETEELLKEIKRVGEKSM